MSGISREQFAMMVIAEEVGQLTAPVSVANVLHYAGKRKAALIASIR